MLDKTVLESLGKIENLTKKHHLEKNDFEDKIKKLRLEVFSKS